MGLGKLMTRPAPVVAQQNRDTIYNVLNTVTGETGTFTVTDQLIPDMAMSQYGAAMTIPGAWRAALLLSGLLAQLPWHAYRNRVGGPPIQIEPDPPLLDQPSPPDTRFSSFRSWMLDYLWDGNAVGVIAARNAQGWPTAILPVPARTVFVRRVTPWIESPFPVGQVEYKIGTLSLGPADVFHVKGPCAPGSIRGLGILESQINTLQLASDQSKQARAIANHGVPTGVLKASSPDVTPTDMAAAKTQWLANQSSRTIQALGPGTDFQPLSWNPDEMEMVESRRFTLTELELIFGLPIGWLGGYDSAKQYSNIAMDAINLQKFSLADHVTAFEQTLSLLFPRGTVVKANLDGILRADTLTRYQAYAIALGNQPWMQPNEVREFEALPPLPEPPESPIIADAVVTGPPVEELPGRPGAPFGSLEQEGAFPGDQTRFPPQGIGTGR